MSVANPPRTRRPEESQAPRNPVRRVATSFAEWFEHRTRAFDTPAASYYVILGATATLTVLGLVMVLSSSSVDAMAAGQSPFSVFVRQLAFAIIGVPIMIIVSRTRAQHVRWSAWPLLAGAAVLQGLVFIPGIGSRVNGNLNWIKIGPVTAQPSEAVKLALIIWVAAVLANKGRLIRQWRHALFPVVLGAGLLIGLVLLGHDLGTTIVMVLILGVMLFVAGAPMRIFLLGGAAVAVAVIPLVLASQSRMNRVAAFFGGECDVRGVCYQSVHGKYALASGGFFGLGLGESREKWSYLPEAHNDFIFAVIGEELGLLGTVILLAMFAGLTLALLRIIRRHDSPFIKIATAGILAWVVGQAAVNIAVVLGLLPVLGVPLPMVSSGGSALMACLAAMGLALSFARQEPGASEALAARVGTAARLIGGFRRKPRHAGMTRSGGAPK